MADERHNDWHTDQPRQIGQGPDRPAGPAADTAGEALAGALRLSFRLLTVIIVMVIVAFLLTGIRQVKTDQVGVRSRFGRIVGTAGPGLTYTWPFPIGHMVIVDLSTRELAIDDFWMFISTADSLKDLSDVRSPARGLRHGWDGALLTGDGNLLHAQLMCKYLVRQGRDPQLNVANAVLFIANVDDQAPEPASRRGEPLHSEQIIRSVVCRAAIHAAAAQTAEMLRTDTGSFTADVMELAQQQLDAMHTGLEIRALNAVRISWPLRVLEDVDEVSIAQQDVARLRRDAEATAQSRLSRTAGRGYELLVGSLEGQGSPGLITRYAQARRDGQDELAETLLQKIETVLTGGKLTDGPQPGLIPLYSQARQEGLDELADRALTRIDEVLLSDVTTGRAQSIIQQALSDRSGIVEPVRGRLARFTQLLPQYQRHPEFTVARLWADTREAILATAFVEKFYFGQGDGRVVVKMNRDPRVARALQRQSLRSEQEEER